MKFKIIILSLLSIFLLIGCSSKEEIKPLNKNTFSCKQEGINAPKWTCVPEVKGFYSSVGIAEKNIAGITYMRKIALMNGRSNLAQQIQTQVKDKVEGFTRVIGNGSDETIDKVTTAVTKQVAKINLKNSKVVNIWNAPSGAIYMLITVPQKNINFTVKSALKSSFKNDNALWQQFQSKQAQKDLNSEFPIN